MNKIAIHCIYQYSLRFAESFIVQNWVLAISLLYRWCATCEYDYRIKLNLHKTVQHYLTFSLKQSLKERPCVLYRDSSYMASVEGHPLSLVYLSSCSIWRHASLWSSSVGTHLQSDDLLSFLQLLFTEISLLCSGFLWAKGWSSVTLLCLCLETCIDTVEPPNKGHVWTRSFVLYREVSFIWRLKCTGIIGIGTSIFVLYREVSFIQSVLYQRFHCITVGLELCT